MQPHERTVSDTAAVRCAGRDAHAFLAGRTDSGECGGGGFEAAEKLHVSSQRPARHLRISTATATARTSAHRDGWWDRRGGRGPVKGDSRRRRRCCYCLVAPLRPAPAAPPPPRGGADELALLAWPNGWRGACLRDAFRTFFVPRRCRERCAFCRWVECSRNRASTPNPPARCFSPQSHMHCGGDSAPSSRSLGEHT